MGHAVYFKGQRFNSQININAIQFYILWLFPDSFKHSVIVNEAYKYLAGIQLSGK